jgi:hypothetical protein
MTLELLNYSETSYNIERSTLVRNFEVNIVRAACEANSATWSFEYQLSICSRADENYGKP